MDRMAQRKMVPVVLVSTTYFGPIQWYQKLYRYDRVLIEQHESWQKQSYRNRCIIATTQGVQALTVPIEHSPLNNDHSECTANNVQGSTFNIQSIKISDHGNWRHLHWQAIQSAYGESPFFEYYEDDLRPFFTERNWELLIDFNDAICQKMCELLDIHPHIERTTQFFPSTSGNPVGFPLPSDSGAPVGTPLFSVNGNPVGTPLPSRGGVRGGVCNFKDFRDIINPKHPLPDPDFTPRPYYQVYAQKHGFLPNLSILDLLLNMGPESIFFL